MALESSCFSRTIHLVWHLSGGVPFFPRKVSYKVLKVPENVSVCTKAGWGSNNYFGTLCSTASNGSYARPYVDLNELQFLTNSSTKKRRTNAKEHHHHQEKCSSNLFKNTPAGKNNASQVHQLFRIYTIIHDQDSWIFLRSPVLCSYTSHC